MNINKIEVKDIASFKGEQVFDFMQEPFCSSRLFALPKGARAKAWLDVISLALYGTISQFEHVENSYAQNLVALGAKDAYAKVTFSFVDGRIFSSLWSIRQNKKGEFMPAEHILQQLSPKKEKWEGTAVVQECMQVLLGLDGKQFATTVFLAQKEFSRFLLAPLSEKRSLLEQLTATGLYSKMSQAIYLRTSEAKEAYQKMLSQLEGIAHDCLSPDALQKEKDALHLAQNKLANDSLMLEQVNAYLQWYEQYHQLQEQLEEASKLQKEAQIAYNEQYDDYVLLERYDQLLPFRATYDAVQEQKAYIDHLRQLLKQTHQQQEAQGQVLDVQKKEYAHALDLYQTIRQEYKIKLPFMFEAHGLQGRIRVNRQNQANTEAHIAQQTAEVNKLQLEIATKQELLNESIHKQQDAQFQLQAITMHQPMVENVGIVIAQLQRMSEWQEGISQSTHALAAIAEDLASTQKLSDEYHLKRNALHVEMLQLQEELNKQLLLKKNLETVDLQQQVVLLSDYYRDVQNACDVWQSMSACYDDQENLINSIRVLTNEITENVEAINSLRKSLPERQKTFNMMQRSYQLGQNYSVVDVRKQITDGAPCPVCGAFHHPYQMHEADEFMDNISADLDEARSALTGEQTQLEQLSIQYSANKSQLEQQNVQLSRLETYLASLQAQWQRCIYLNPTFEDYSISVNRTSRSMLLSQLRDKAQQDLAAVKQQYAQYIQCQQSINEINEHIVSLSQKEVELVDAQKGVQSRADVYEQRRQELTKRKTQSETSVELLAGQLEETIVMPNWKDQCLKDVGELIQQITDIAETWKQNQDILHEEQQKAYQLQVEVDRITQELNEIIQQNTNNQAYVQALLEDSNQAESCIRQYFNGKTLDEFSQYIEDEMLATERTEKQTLDILEHAQNQYNDISSQLEALNNLLSGQMEELSRRNMQMDEQISHFNIDHSPVRYAEIDNIFTDGRNWKKLRTKVYACQDRLEKANRYKEQLDKELVCLLNSDLHPEELQNEIQCQKERGQLQRSILAHEADIFNHQVLLQKHQDALDALEALGEQKQQLEQQWQCWDRLNKVAGSADGNKFRSIVQERLLKLIVQGANGSLAALKSPHRLEVAEGDTLQLQILNLDMFEQSVALGALTMADGYTLSLALAMGLAMLQGSQTEKSDFLVVDAEGLSGEDLYVVMDRLRHLQHTLGGTIGVAQ